MATNSDIVLTKGNYSVTLFTGTPTENWKNNLEVVPGVTSVSNQDQAPENHQVL